MIVVIVTVVIVTVVIVTLLIVTVVIVTVVIVTAVIGGGFICYIMQSTRDFCEYVDRRVLHLYRKLVGIHINSHYD